MRKYFNKLYLSIALVVLSLLTMVATTYAWVGLFTNTTFDEFTINLQQDYDKDSEYGIALSLDGVNFNEGITQEQLRRRLLYNMDPVKYVNYLDSNAVKDNLVNESFRKNVLTTCTTWRDPYNPKAMLGKFYDMNNQQTNLYYWFDLYLSLYKIGGTTTEDSERNLEIYLRDSILSASTATNQNGIYRYRLFNSVTYPDSQGSFLGQPILNNPNVQNTIMSGTEIDGEVAIDVSTTCRVALQKYIAVDKGQISQYQFVDPISDLYIFQSGSIYPTYNPTTGVSDFGGVLPDEYNFARVYYNRIHQDSQLGSIPNEVLNRGDKTFVDDGVSNKIISTSDGVKVSKMARFRIYFWFEGWDSNCFDVIDRKKVTLNLAFSTKSPNDENNNI